MAVRISTTIIAAAFLSLQPCFSQVVITEIQRDPAGLESVSPGGLSHEFVEIANLGTDTFWIDSLFLTDGMEADAVIPWTDSLPAHADCDTGVARLAPGATALILDRDYAAAIRQVPSSVLPICPGTVLLTVADGDLGNGLAADDGLLLYKGTAAAVDTIIWCAAATPFSGGAPIGAKILLPPPRDAREGISTVPAAFLFDSVRYVSCGDSLTPGAYELLRNSWFAESRFGDIDTGARAFPCTLACIKAGALPHRETAWQVTVTSPAATRTVARGALAVSGNRGSAAASLPLDSAAYLLKIVENGITTSWPLDVSALWTPANPVRINELFPRANAGEPEWFELVNVSSMPVNLADWTFGNSEGRDTLSMAELPLRPGGYLVVTANLALFRARYPAKNAVTQPQRWHALDNYNDTLCLWDRHGRRAERVCYRSSWLTEWQNQSIERVGPAVSGMDAASWALAPYPTPGQPNTNASWRNGATAALTIGPLPFTPNGDGKDDRLSVAVELPAGATASIAIYGFSGNKLRSFPVPVSGRFFWDGKKDNGSPAPLGPFFAVMETTSGSGKTIVRKKGVLWR
jgi:hypothetical protein